MTTKRDKAFKASNTLQKDAILQSDTKQLKRDKKQHREAKPTNRHKTNTHNILQRCVKSTTQRHTFPYITHKHKTLERDKTQGKILLQRDTM